MKHKPTKTCKPKPIKKPIIARGKKRKRQVRKKHKPKKIVEKKRPEKDGGKKSA